MGRRGAPLPLRRIHGQALPHRPHRTRPEGGTAPPHHRLNYDRLTNSVEEITDADLHHPTGLQPVAGLRARRCRKTSTGTLSLGMSSACERTGRITHPVFPPRVRVASLVMGTRPIAAEPAHRLDYSITHLSRRRVSIFGEELTNPKRQGHTLQPPHSCLS